MNINIEVKEINKHFNLKVINNEIDKKKYTSKICKYDFFSVNEASICQIISEIPYYENNFCIICDYDFVNMDQINNETLEKQDKNVKKMEEKYILFQYKKNKFISFNDYLFDITTPKALFLCILESFPYLLKSLIKLNNNNICFFDLTPENIVFNRECGFKPILINFQNSLNLLRINESYISRIIEKSLDFTYKPLELHILFYLENNNLNTLSYTIIEEICEVYVKNLQILNMFSQSYKLEFKTLCVNSLKKYINKSKSDIINDILERSLTWDIYSLSIIYLHIIGNISRVFSLKGTFFNKLTLFLMKNISPDSLKRESLTKTLENYEKLYDEFKDWNFIKNIPMDKMDKLFKVLAE
jgi:hypothetical protein